MKLQLDNGTLKFLILAALLLAGVAGSEIVAVL
jgi:predicted ATPase